MMTTYSAICQSDFRFHFRISKEMFYDIVSIDDRRMLASQHGGGSADVVPSKQVLVYLSYPVTTHEGKWASFQHNDVNCSRCCKKIELTHE